MFLNQRGQKGWEKQIPTAKFRKTRFRFLLPQTRPGWAEQRKLPGAQRRDPGCGSPFFWVLFFGEAKNKCLACRGETRQGRGGLALKTKHKSVPHRGRDKFNGISNKLSRWLEAFSFQGPESPTQISPRTRRMNYRKLRLGPSKTTCE